LLNRIVLGQAPALFLLLRAIAQPANYFWARMLACFVAVGTACLWFVVANSAYRLFVVGWGWRPA